MALRPAQTGVLGDGSLRVKNKRTKTAAVIGTMDISYSSKDLLVKLTVDPKTPSPTGHC